MSALKIMVTSLSLSTFLAAPAYANFLEDAGKVVTAPVKAVVRAVEEVVVKPLDKVNEKVIKPVTNGAKNVIEDTVDSVEAQVKMAVALSGLKTLDDVLREGKSLDQSLDEVLEDGKNGLKAAAYAPMILNHLDNATTEVVTNVLGKEAGKAMALLALPEQIARALPAALMETAIATSEKGSNGEQIVGVPLNAALKQAHQYYADRAAPLTPKVAKMLELGGYDQGLIANARYVVDDGTGSIAGIINYLMTQFGEKTETNHAVAIGNIIVFAQQPGETIKDLYFWAHEVKHTGQYDELGFDGFAGEYTTNHGRLESEADAAAVEAYAKVKDILVALAG